MYKPLTGEWGERSRDEECDRIIVGIEQLITVGASAETGPSLLRNSRHADSHCVCVCCRDFCSVLRSRGFDPVSHILHINRLPHRLGHHQAATAAQVLQVGPTGSLPPVRLSDLNLTLIQPLPLRRRLSALVWDARYIAHNARTFNEPRSKIAFSAKIITNVLQKFIKYVLLGLVSAVCFHAHRIKELVVVFLFSQ